jgi:hypothetical protein
MQHTSLVSTIASLFLPDGGVSDKIFRQLTEARGADVLTTNSFLQGIFRRNDQTRSISTLTKLNGRSGAAVHW